MKKTLFDTFHILYKNLLIIRPFIQKYWTNWNSWFEIDAIYFFWTCVTRYSVNNYALFPSSTLFLCGTLSNQTTAVYKLLKCHECDIKRLI